MVNPSLNGPTSEDKLWGGLSYVGLACCMIPTIIIFLLKKEESSFIKFHSLQAIFFWLASFVIGVVLSILSQIPAVGMIFAIVQFIISLGVLGYWIYLIIMAFTGKDVRIPMLSDFIDQNLMG